MKNLSKFLFVFGLLCMISSDVQGDRSFITVKNELNPKDKAGPRLIMAYCKSKNNMIGPRYLKFEEIMIFGFKTNVWGTTEFWCVVKEGPHYNKRYGSFTAYKAKGLFVKDDGTKWNWSAKDDGFYFHKGNMPSLKLANWTMN
ncbi:hypothetical protein EUTSA_v10005094mg [Eutrema salsugineum]|uniref:S-protein homolog n=1 Tax=Eutrema salsugineum TaxID=72664 RepID=V4KS07_EUTSA|nr:S-protein homolog 21 [Eutrema salsugineum]ESQ32797.1 hypothetical protein EUTSA_v10005094mg [Eutrema salsugineum]